MSPEASSWKRQLPRAVTASVVGLGICLALVGAAPKIDDPPPRPAAGGHTPRQSAGEQPELDGGQVVAYEDHPAAAIMDSVTRKILATRHVAGFGGAYVDEEADVLHVWLTRPTQELGHKAREALHQGAGFDTLSARKIVVHKARYTFAELKAWKDIARELFVLPEVVMLDVSERINRIWVGVRGQDDLSPIAVERLADLGIPADAVVTANVPQPPEPALRDGRRPLAGGTQIQFQTGTGGVGTGACTLGFPAIRDGQLGFVINAHCSRTRGAVDDGRYWQATRPALDTNQVGTEIVDPPFFVGGPCPAGDICSFTDAIFVRAHGGVGVDRGRLAAVPCCGSLNWNGTNTWRVTDNFFTFTGNAVRKVGRTSGTTSGYRGGGVHRH